MEAEHGGISVRTYPNPPRPLSDYLTLSFAAEVWSTLHKNLCVYLTRNHKCKRIWTEQGNVPWELLRQTLLSQYPHWLKHWDHLLMAQNVHGWLADPIASGPESLAVSPVRHSGWRAGFSPVITASFDQSLPWKPHTATKPQVQTGLPTASRTGADALIWNKTLMLPPLHFLFSQLSLASLCLMFGWSSAASAQEWQLCPGLGGMRPEKSRETFSTSSLLPLPAHRRHWLILSLLSLYSRQDPRVSLLLA